MKLMPSILLLLLGSGVYAEEKNFALLPKESPFYIYKDFGSRSNHGTPSGWIGSYKSLSFNQRVKNENGTCMEVRYNISKDTETIWAGIVFQHPPMNWSSMRGGYDLRGFKKLVFQAKGTKGDEYISEFFFGGAPEKQYQGDSDMFYIERITLNKDWKEYEISLDGLDLSHIISLFGFSLTSEYNDHDVDFFVDNVRFEK